MALRSDSRAKERLHHWHDLDSLLTRLPSDLAKLQFTMRSRVLTLLNWRAMAALLMPSTLSAATLSNWPWGAGCLIHVDTEGRL